MPYDKAFQEALQSYYESHDFTGRIPAFDAGKYTPAQTAVYLKAKTFFSQAWVKLLPDIGNKRSMKNFSPDYPLNCLKDGDAAYIADAVTEVFFDEEQFNDALDFFFSTLQEPLEVGLNACAKAHGKEVDDLSDDEIADVVGKLTDLYMEELVHALMVAQKAPGIYTALHSGKEKLTVHGDFNQSVKENHDKINFDKRWTHSDTKLGEALSLEQVAKNNPEAVAAGTDFFSSPDSNEDAYIELRNGFLATLSEADHFLFTLREEGKTQKEIADQLGYKTHSAVSKRLQTMRGQFEKYMRTQQ